MKTSETQAFTFEEKREREVRTCPQCHLRVSNPFIERCPRCFNQLARLNLDCTGCFFQKGCSVAGQREETNS